jgi:hypothetical protein
LLDPPQGITAIPDNHVRENRADDLELLIDHLAPLKITPTCFLAVYRRSCSRRVRSQKRSRGTSQA